MHSRARKKLFIDADAILSQRPSGVGSVTLELIRALSTDADIVSKYKIILIVPFNRVAAVRLWGFNENVRVRRSLLTGKVVKLLALLHILPPFDLFFGKGIYLFTNFRNWPLLFSKSATYIHDVSFKVHPEYVEKKNLAYLLRNVNKWISRADVVITVSEHAKKEIETYYTDAKGKVVVVPNGITADFKPQSADEVDTITRKYDLVPKHYFMFLSNIEPRKNIMGLLDAYEAFVKHRGNENVKLLLVGGMGWNNDEILKRIAEMNMRGKRVIRPEHYVSDSELPALLTGSAALIHPAHYEGFGISPLQAMACGTQIVVANNTSIPEVVGDSGIYVDDSDAKDILRGMKLAYNKKDESNKKGIRRAQDFSWRRSARILGMVLERLESNERKA